MESQIQYKVISKPNSLNKKGRYVKIPYHIPFDALIKFNGRTYKYFAHSVIKYTGDISVMTTRADLPESDKITDFFHLERSVADSIFSTPWTEDGIVCMSSSKKVVDLTGKAKLFNEKQVIKWAEQMKKKYEPSFLQRLFRR